MADRADRQDAAANVVVDVVDRTRAAVDAAAMTELVADTLRAEGVVAAEVGVTLVGERRIRALNRDYRGIDAVTDVLSFPLEEPGEYPPAGVPRLLGDVVICPVRAERQAAAEGIPRSRELALLIVHGVLHLLGWEHDDGSGAGSRAVAERAADMLARQSALVDGWAWERLW